MASRRALLLLALTLTTACASPRAGASAEATVVSIAVPPPPAELPAASGRDTDDPPADGRGLVTGLGRLHIGQPIDEVRSLLGPETELLSEETDREGWQEQGYDPDEELMFLIGFDALLVWNEPPEGADLPVWKVYAREGRVVYIVLSSFTAAEMDVSRVGFSPSCFMRRKADPMEAACGPGYLHEQDEEHGHESYHYLDRGLTVITVDGEIRVFNIYGALGPGARARFRQVLGR
jgi:hypothetical protein